MTKRKQDNDQDDMLPEYDFSNGVRGKYAAAYRRAQRLIVLDHDVARVFKDSRAVNDALRALAQILRDHGKRAKK